MGGRAVWSRFGRVLKMGNFDWTLIVSFPIFKGERFTPTRLHTSLPIVFKETLKSFFTFI